MFRRHEEEGQDMEECEEVRALSRLTRWAELTKVVFLVCFGNILKTYESSIIIRISQHVCSLHSIAIKHLRVVHICNMS